MSDQNATERLVSAMRTRLAEVHEALKPLQAEREVLEGMLGRSKAEVPAPDAASEPAHTRVISKRSRKGGTRAENAVKYFEAHPGATASDYAKDIGIQVNYLYRVLGGLVNAQVLEKNGRGYKVV